MSNNVRPYDAMKINVAQLSEQLVQFHGGPYHETLYPKGHIEGVISYGPPGIGKTQSVMAAAERIAKENGYELVVYRPGVKHDPSKKQLLFVHMSMAGMTSGRIAGYPTTAIEDSVLDSDSADVKSAKQKRYVSRQVIPTIWRTAMEFPAAMYLFDEITHVISQEAMLSLLSEGFYEETSLCQRALFVATANEGIADGTFQQKLSAAFKNRFRSYYVRGDVDVWRKQYANQTVHPACLAYASMYKSRFENFQTPDDNLLNTATLRSLTYLSEDMQYFEMRNLRKPKQGPNGEVSFDPRGELKENIQITDSQESAVMRLAYGLLGKEHYAQDFVSMYTLAYTQVIPEIKNVMNDKPVSAAFKAAIDIDSADRVKVQKSLLESTERTDDKLKQAQDDVAKAYTYVDYLPRMVLDAWRTLPTNPQVVAKGLDKDPSILRGMTKTLMTNFLKGVLLLPSNMRMMALHHMIELCDTPEIKAAGAPFMGNGFEVKDSAVPQVILFKVITENADKEDYKRLQDAIKDMKDAKSVADDLKI